MTTATHTHRWRIDSPSPGHRMSVGRCGCKQVREFDNEVPRMTHTPISGLSRHCSLCDRSGHTAGVCSRRLVK